MANAGTLCPDAAGVMLLHAAWVSPKFTSCSFSGVSPREDGGKEISFKVVGDSRISKLSDKEIWVVGTAVVDSRWRIKTVKWGSYKAAVPPGVTTALGGKVLAGMSK
jgi:hypothetical protein